MQMLISLHSPTTDSYISFHTGWTDGGICQLSRSGYITSRFGNLLTRLGCGLIQGWTPDINANAAAANTGFAIRQRFLIQSPDPKGRFNVPFQCVGFTDDYTKVTYGMRDTLQLIRKDDNDARFRTAAAGAGKVVLSKLAWVIPIVQAMCSK